MRSDFNTVLDALRWHTDRQPDKLLFAFLDADGRTVQSYTYEAFLRRTAEIASHLHNTHPLQPGERVLLVYPPGLEVICAFYACARLGLIPVPVYPPSSHGFAAARHRMNAIAQDCGAAVVLTDRAYYWSMKLHSARTRIATLSFSRDYSSGLEWIVTGDAEPNGARDFPEAHSDILFLQYTSGSTSEPKGVMVTHRNVLANCEAVVDHTPVAVSWLPQYHDMGLIAFYLFSPIRGGTTFGSSPMDFIQRPLLWLEAMSRHRATASAAPNFAYEYCLRPDKVPEEALHGLDLSSLRLLFNGAEPVKASVLRDFTRRFERHGLPAESFSAAYGLAENTLAACLGGRTVESFDADQLAADLVRPADASTETGVTKTFVSCGPASGASEVKIVDAAKATEVPEGRVGEVWIDGPSKCLGYWGRPEISAETFDARIDGIPERSWLRTGDLGFVHGGELFLCGRAKDLIIVRGANFYPQDIEAIVQEEPGIRRGCVAAFSAEEDEGDRVVVVAELKNRGHRPDVRAINQTLRQRLGIGADEVVFIAKRTIPKTSSGKISRHRVREAWREGRLEILHRVDATLLSTGGSERAGDEAQSGEPEGTNRASVERLFRKHRLTGQETVTLSEAGIDSLGLVDLTLDLEEHLEDVGASDLAAGVEARWIQTIPISELFELVCDVAEAAPHAKLRFRQAFARLRREHLEGEQETMRRDAGLSIDVTARGEAATARGSDGPGVLLTGGTGFFGPFLLRSLLEQTDDDVAVLVRARDEDHARQRLAEGLASLGGLDAGSPIEGWESRVVPLCGDLTLPAFGMEADQWGRLGDSVHTVYHNGALVNYLLDYARMRDTNVGSTVEVLRFASSGRTKVLNHVSTTFIFGWSTKETLSESDRNQDMALLDFGYSQSKWVSEQLVLRALSDGLPGRVFRPALISPSVQGGGHNFDIAIRLLAFMLDHGITTTAGNQVSLMPADVTANNIVAIANLADTLGGTFHVTRDEYSTLRDVTDILGDLTGTDFEAYSVDDFVPLMIERCRKGDLLFPLVNFLVHSVDNITAMEFKRYDSSRYQEARDRSPAGVADPPLIDVVAGIVRFMARHGIVDAAKARSVLQEA